MGSSKCAAASTVVTVDSLDAHILLLSAAAQLLLYQLQLRLIAPSLSTVAANWTVVTAMTACLKDDASRTVGPLQNAAAHAAARLVRFRCKSLVNENDN